MFALEVLIGAEDIHDEAKMRGHRESLDAAAKGRRAAFVREEIEPYIVRVKRRGETEPRALPATEETKKYVNLKRLYE